MKRYQQEEPRHGYILIDAYRVEALLQHQAGNERKAAQLRRAADKMEFLTKLHRVNKQTSSSWSFS